MQKLIAMSVAFPPSDSNQHRRRRFVAFSLVTHTFNILCLALLVAQGWLAPVYAVGFFLCAMASVAIFYYVVLKGWNLRIRDPSLAFGQLVFGTTLGIATMSQMSTTVGRGLLALTGMVSITYAASILDRRRLLLSMSIAAVECVLMTTYVMRDLVDTDARRAELALLAIMLGSLLQVCLYGSVTAALRTKVRERTDSLDAALEQLRETNAALEVERDAAASQAIRDELTGVFNRRHLEAEMVVQVARSQRRGSPLTVALLDIDHFKEINDRFGHQAGDEALRHVTDVMSRRIRGVDIFGRWGGEEFLLIMPDTPLDKAQVLCNRLRDAVRTTRPDAIVDSDAITLSGGVAQLRNGEARDEVIHRADIALYQAKTSGRDRIAVN